MPNTYTQLYIQTVFAVKYRHGLIHSEWKEHLYRYMTGIVQNQDHKVLAINGMPDHIHVFPDKIRNSRSRIFYKT